MRMALTVRAVRAVLVRGRQKPPVVTIEGVIIESLKDIPDIPDIPRTGMIIAFHSPLIAYHSPLTHVSPRAGHVWP